jgi:L-fuculose-phosphate aldolase
MPDFLEERKTVASYMSRLYERNLTTLSGGNISTRENNHIFITPSGKDKANIQAHEIAIMDLQGNNLTTNVKVSTEAEMHLEIYRTKNTRAIIHAHPVYATSFTATAKKINTRLIAESWAILGEPAYTPYELMGTRDLATRVAESAKHGDVILLQNHGVITMADSIHVALDMVEVLEFTAKMNVICQALGDISMLDDNETRELTELMNKRNKEKNAN